MAQANPEPSIAPPNCAKMYPGAKAQSNLPTAANPMVTAGLRCAPLEGPAMTTPQNTTYIYAILPDIPVGRLPAENIAEAKVVLKVTSEQMLMEYYEKAISLGYPAIYIEDAGRTQIEPGSKTVVAIGPCPEEDFAFTKSLKLL